MSEIDDLEEIAKALARLPHSRTDRRGPKSMSLLTPFDYGHRNEAAHPKKPPPAADKPKQHKASPKQAPIIVPAPTETIAVVRTHEDITEVFRMMKERLGLTNKWCDDVGEFVEGWTDKVLGPSEAKKWGPKSFDKFVEMLAIEFVVRVNVHAAARMEEIWEGRIRPIDLPKNKRVSAKAIERAKPHVLRSFSELGNAARNKMLPAEHRSKIARKAARARWRKPRTTAREAPAAKA